ncbi:MAG: alpha/beta hydrolase [Leptospiraceae bacterium]|nr:alpha/beta hydrolase [Leptospiraceae bacterium]MDW7975547.1 YqiA/YcfP family alpha/beta fold hydrolase [Leptospiraceae bacterium]
MKIIYLHGFASSPSSQKAKFFKKNLSGYDIIVPDLNCGNFTNMTITKQIEIIKDIMKTNPKEKYILIGSSMGGYVSLLCMHLISQEKIFKNIHKLVLLAPALEFTKRILRKDKEKFQKWKKEGYIEIEHYAWKKTLPLNFLFYIDAKTYEKLEFTREIPVLIFHGVYDEVVPYEVSLKYLKQNSLSHLVLLNSDHSLLNSLNTILTYTQQFLRL